MPLFWVIRCRSGGIIVLWCVKYKNSPQKKGYFLYFSWTSHSKIAKIATAGCIRYLGTPSREEMSTPEHNAIH